MEEITENKEKILQSNLMLVAIAKRNFSKVSLPENCFPEITIIFFNVTKWLCTKYTKFIIY